jgi:hypothetical protein
MSQIRDGSHEMGEEKAGVEEGRKNAHLPNDFPREPQERLLEVVVRLGRDFVILEVLFSVECDSGSLNFSLLHNNSNRHQPRSRRLFQYTNAP